MTLQTLGRIPYGMRGLKCDGGPVAGRGGRVASHTGCVD